VVKRRSGDAVDDHAVVEFDDPGMQNPKSSEEKVYGQQH
jgi:hypothetical protein